MKAKKSKVKKSKKSGAKKKKVLELGSPELELEEYSDLPKQTEYTIDDAFIKTFRFKHIQPNVNDSVSETEFVVEGISFGEAMELADKVRQRL